VIAAIAPRPVFIVAPVHDDNFDVEGVRETVTAARPIFEMLGNREGLQVIYPDCGHDFPDAARHEAYNFLSQHLESHKQ
jgi:hypothetical protein